jgi:hypothetical protein
MTNALMGMERSRSGSLVAAHGQFIYGFRTALAISIELVITGMLIASRIRQPRSSAGTMTAGTPDRQTGAGQADTQLVRDHRRPYSPERTTRPSASSAGQFPRPSCVCGGVNFLLAGNGAGTGVRNRSPRFAGSLGRVLLVQADEQGDQLAAHRPGAQQVRQLGQVDEPLRVPGGPVIVGSVDDPVHTMVVSPASCSKPLDRSRQIDPGSSRRAESGRTGRLAS